MIIDPAEGKGGNNQLRKNSARVTDDQPSAGGH